MIIIGKSANPRCFKNINRKSLAVEFYSNKTAWMNSKIFNEYLSLLNKQFVRGKRKVILSLDNFSGHPITNVYSNIKIEFFPANCTSVLQPLDQGIIQNFKVYYRQQIVNKIVSEIK
jgi:hypothetical protein